MNVYKFNEQAYPRSRCGVNDPRLPIVLRMLGTEKSVPDIGCLDGTVGARLAEAGNRITGIDAAQAAVEKAKCRGIDARVGDLNDPLPFPTASFDAVFAGEILEHVFDIDTLLSQISRVLRPSGLLIVTTPNLAALGRRLLLMFNRNPHIEISFSGDAAGHIRYFVRSTLSSILGKHGFLVESIVSDVVNFNSSGSLRSLRLARLYPSLGKTLIAQARKK
jgi:SAM-dependent methyltransferase